MQRFALAQDSVHYWALPEDSEDPDFFLNPCILLVPQRPSEKGRQFLDSVQKCYAAKYFIFHHTGTSSAGLSCWFWALALLIEFKDTFYWRRRRLCWPQTAQVKHNAECDCDSCFLLLTCHMSCPSDSSAGLTDPGSGFIPWGNKSRFNLRKPQTN